MTATMPIVTASNTTRLPERTPRYAIDGRVLDLPPLRLPTDLGTGRDFVLDGFSPGRWDYRQMRGDTRLTVYLPGWSKEAAS
jgi:hypothetical protein